MTKADRVKRKSRTSSRKSSKVNIRLAVLSVIVLAGWLLIMGKLFWLQVVNHESVQLVRNNLYNQELLLVAERGTIRDRNGTALTMNLPHYDLGAHPPVVENPELMAKVFSETFGKSTSYYMEKLSTDKNFVWMERKVAPAKGLAIIRHDFKGISAIKQSKRFYPYDEIGAQVIGFTDVDNNGIEGIEKTYDEFLKGTDGHKSFKIDGKGRDLSGLLSRTVEPIPGGDLILTLDREYQIILQEEILSAYKSKKAENVIGIILQPRTGELLAMASAPGFNPNEYTKYPVANYKNRTITDIYEPGSTFKLVTATTAIELNLYNDSDLIFCENGKIDIQNVSISDHKPYGWLTFNQVFYNSSNVGVIKVAQNAGRENIYKMARAFGFGNKTGLSLDGESNGILRELKKWSALSLAEVAIGYEVSVTPLQLAMAYAAAANGGYLLKPQIIRSAKSSDGKVDISDEVKVIRRVMSPETSEKLKELFLGVVKVGTGKKAYIRGFRVAGKSGTSQKIIDGKHSNDYYASFVAFFPAEDPEFLCLIIVDDPKTYLPYGGEVAAPIVKKIFTRIANANPHLFVSGTSTKIERSNSPLREEAKHENSFMSLQTVRYVEPNLQDETVPGNIMPNVKGMSLRYALKILGDRNLNPKFSGSGIVKKQRPSAGTRITNGSEVILTMGQESE